MDLIFSQALLRVSIAGVCDLYCGLGSVGVDLDVFHLMVNLSVVILSSVLDGADDCCACDRIEVINLLFVWFACI